MTAQRRGISPIGPAGCLLAILAVVAVGCGSSDSDEQTTVPATTDAAADAPAVDDGAPTLDQLWSAGLINLRTGEPLVFVGGEHMIAAETVSDGYNVVVDRDGMTIAPTGAPLVGGEQLVLTETYQEDANVRGYAQAVALMAPIRDAILYHYEELSADEWLEITDVLTINGIKTEDAAEVNGRAILSSTQLFDFIATGPTDGGAVARYLEEAELELKCLALVDFDFTNPEGANHCDDHGLVVGAGIELP